MVHALRAPHSFRSDSLYKGSERRAGKGSHRMSMAWCHNCFKVSFYLPAVSPLFLFAYLSSFHPSKHKNRKKSQNNPYTTKDDLDHVSTFLIETASNIPTSCYLASSNHLWQRKAPNLRTRPHVLKASSSLITSSPTPSTPKSRYVVCVYRLPRRAKIPRSRDAVRWHKSSEQLQKAPSAQSVDHRFHVCGASSANRG